MLTHFDQFRSCLQVLYKIRRQGIATKLRAKDFYKDPSIKGLARLIESEAAAVSVVRTVEDCNLQSMERSFDLLPIQEEFFKANMVQPNHYNQAFTVLLPRNHAYSFEKISAAIEQLALHHGILKCLVRDRKHLYVEDSSTFRVHDMSDKELSEADLCNFNASLDIENGPVWMAVLHSRNKVFFVFHHLIVDVVSWSIIAEDFKTIMNGSELGPKTSGYDQWVSYVKQYGSKVQDSQLTYWKQQQDDIVSMWDTTDTMIKCTKTVNPEQTTQLVTQKAYIAQPNELLLAALSLALNRIDGNKKHSVTLEGIGRLNSDDDPDVSRTVGWFTTMFPIGLDSTNGNDIGDVIISTKESIRRIPDKGLGYGALVQNGSLKDLVAPVVFNYLGKIGGKGSSNTWEIAPNEQTGKVIADGNRDTKCELEINCFVNAETGELEIHFQSFWENKKHEAFCEAFLEAIGDVVSHVSGVPTTVMTPSDYSTPQLNLTIDWLQRLQSRFSGYKIQSMYTATSLQQAFVAHAVAHPSDDAYCTQFMFEFDGAFDANVYRRAWDYTIQGFPTLRCAFDWEGSEPLMVVVETVEPPEINIVDIRYDDRTVEDVRLADRKVVYDLSRPCLIR